MVKAALPGFGTMLQRQGGDAQATMSSATLGGSEYRPKTDTGKLVGAGFETLPGAIAFGGTSPANMLQYGILPGVASEKAGQLTEGSPIEPWARFGAGIVAPVVAGAGNKLLRYVISPHGGVNQRRLDMVKVLDDYDIGPVTAGQKVGSEKLQRVEMSTGRGQDMLDAQKTSFTKAILKTAGTDADGAFPDVLKATDDRIGAVFDSVTKGVDVVPDAQDLQGVSKALATYTRLSQKGNITPAFTDINKKMVSSFRTGQPIDADALAIWRSDMSVLRKSGDIPTAQAAVDMMEALDDTIAAALTKAGKPEAAAQLNKARGEWRNFIVIEKAAASPTFDAVTGALSPAVVRSAVSRQGARQYVQGTRGDIGDVGRAASTIFKTQPRPGTAGEATALGIPQTLSASFGAWLGSAGGPVGTAAGATAGLLGPSMLRSAKAGPLQGYLANQLVKPGSAGIDKRMIGLLSGLLSQNEGAR